MSNNEENKIENKGYKEYYCCICNIKLEIPSGFHTSLKTNKPICHEHWKKEIDDDIKKENEERKKMSNNGENKIDNKESISKRIIREKEIQDICNQLKILNYPNSELKKNIIIRTFYDFELEKKFDYQYNYILKIMYLNNNPINLEDINDKHWNEFIIMLKSEIYNGELHNEDSKSQTNIFPELNLKRKYEKIIYYERNIEQTIKKLYNLFPKIDELEDQIKKLTEENESLTKTTNEQRKEFFEIVTKLTKNIAELQSSENILRNTYNEFVHISNQESKLKEMIISQKEIRILELEKEVRELKNKKDVVN